MSKETDLWLNKYTATGFIDLYGPAWHDDRDLRIREMLTENQFHGAVPLWKVDELLSFDLISCEVKATGTFVSPDGNIVEIDSVDPRRQAIVTSDTHEVLGVFSKNYKIHPYRDTLLGILGQLVGDPMAEDMGLQIKSIGLLRNRAVAWVQVVAPKEVYAGALEAQPFISIATSCDGSLATTAVSGTQLIVCDNTLFAALRAAQMRIKLKHTLNSVDRLDDVASALQVMTTASRTTSEIVDMLSQTPVNERETEKYYTIRFGDQPTEDGRGRTKWINRRDAFMTVMSTPAVKPFVGTALGLVQADSTFRHHKNAAQTEAMPGNKLARNMWHAAHGETQAEDAASLAAVQGTLKSSRRKQLVFASA